MKLTIETGKADLLEIFRRSWRHPVLLILAVGVAGCAYVFPANDEIEIHIEAYDGSRTVEGPPIAPIVVVPREIRATDRDVKTVSFKNENGNGYFQIDFRYLPAREQGSEYASVIVTKAYCASTPDVKSGIETGTPSRPYCAQRTDIPVEISEPKQILMEAGRGYSIALGNGDSVLIDIFRSNRRHKSWWNL